MNKTNLTLAIAMAALTSSATYAGPASSFSAHIRDASDLEGLYLLHSGVANTNNNNPDMLSNSADILETGIKTANKKDLLIGVSLQNGLFTDTTVKGKNGSSESASAEGAIEVCVEVTRDSDGLVETVLPECVMFAKRYQELNATLGGVIETCAIAVDPNTGEGELDVARDCIVTEEEIQLILSTTSANHFNFVAPDLSPGDHTVTVNAEAISSAAFTNGTFSYESTEDDCLANGGVWDSGTCTETTADNEAQGYALVEVGSLTVQQVRAINQSGGITYNMDTDQCYDMEGQATPCFPE